MRQKHSVLLIISTLIVGSLLSGCAQKATEPADVVFDKQPSPFHCVKTGESVASIAREYNMDMQELVVLNSLKPPYRLVTGQRLIVSPATAFRPTDTYESVEVIEGQPDGIQTSPNSGIFVPPPPAVDLSDSDQPNNVMLTQQSGYLSASGTGVQPEMQATAPTATEHGQHLMPSQPDLAVENAPATVVAPEPTLPTSGTYSWPVRGEIIRAYGAGQGQNKNDGINIKAPLSTPVNAANNGRVAHTGNQIGGFGNVVLIKHDHGYMTVYAHLDEVSVKKGDAVKIGQKIGTVGKSGNAKQTQLHFEIRKGTTPLNPENLLK